MAKIGDIYRKPGVPGFLVDVVEEGVDTIRRFNFGDEMLQEDKWLAEVQRVLAEHPIVPAAKVPGAIDPLEAAKKHKGLELSKEIKTISK